MTGRRVVRWKADEIDDFLSNVLSTMSLEELDELDDSSPPGRRLH